MLGKSYYLVSGLPQLIVSTSSGDHLSTTHRKIVLGGGCQLVTSHKEYYAWVCKIPGLKKAFNSRISDDILRIQSGMDANRSSSKLSSIG